MTETIFRQGAKPHKPSKAQKAKPQKAANAARKDRPKAAKGAAAPKGAKASKAARAKPASPSLVDPRLQARRIEVARGQGRRRLRWVAAGVVVVLLIVGAFALTRSPVLDVDAVTVRGASTVDRSEVVEASGIVAGTPMLDVDGSAAASRIEALPWIDHATVTRNWPGAVTISVVERTPVAAVGEGSAAVAVDREGRVLGPAGDRDLPVIAGDPADVGTSISATQRWVAGAVAGLPTDLRREVAQASATPTGIRLTLTDGIVVRWGDTAQPRAKADALQVLLDQADRATIATIDVTVPRAATVTRS